MVTKEVLFSYGPFFPTGNFNFPCISNLIKVSLSVEINGDSSFVELCS